ncbi:peptidoglycan DD-metalloendopeptidase family protein [Candidatus Peregrinibacteria bacterium]|nr:peptidoglycan DD-metalloendopeptidase family protein [Candidatus Peregrinibacteria bacterium]
MTKRAFSSIFLAGIIFNIFLSYTSFPYAHLTYTRFPYASAQSPSSDTPAPQEALSESSQEFLRNNLIIKKLRQKLHSNENYSSSLDENMGETKEKLTQTQVDIRTLSEQIAEIDRQIRISEQNIFLTKSKIIDTETTIQKVYANIEQKEIELDGNKSLLSYYFKMLYMHDLRYMDSDDVNVVKIFLSDASVGETFQKETYYTIFKTKTIQLLAALQSERKALDEKKASLTSELTKLDKLQKSLEAQQSNLEAQKIGKGQLLKDTQGKEEIYQTLLAETLKQQEEVAEEIRALRSNIDYFNDRLNNLRDTITPEEYQEILKIKTEAVSSSTQLQSGDILKFEIWPVNPKNGISAYFTDTGYKKIFKVDHGAVDIPTLQETPILAPANGLVVKVRDNDTGYNYIAIAHQKGVMTVFGHISASLVDVGDFVHQGDMIALSGGIPGTRGSGLRTTGAHLHFEVFQDGARVDPLGYLPLEALDKKYIPEMYRQDENAVSDEISNDSLKKALESAL